MLKLLLAGAAPCACAGMGSNQALVSATSLAVPLCAVLGIQKVGCLLGQCKQNSHGRDAKLV
eukprot:scaffold180883_cov22-Tisochrysis_lutea.AAC.1